VNRYIDSIKIYSEYLSRTNQSLLEIKNLKRLQEKPSLPDYFTLDEMRSLLACELGHDKYGLRERYSLFFSCMAYMGLRFSEVAKLTPNHFAHQQNHFYVHIRDGKTGDRTILVPSRLWTLLAAYMKNYLRPKTYLLFVTRRGSAITHYSATEELRKRCIKLGIDESRARTHNFRHGFCTEAARAGFTSLQLKPITGHKRLETLEKYVHLSGHDTKIIESHPLNN
jgi:integrase/recombinase XerD